MVRIWQMAIRLGTRALHLKAWAGAMVWVLGPRGALVELTG